MRHRTCLVGRLILAASLHLVSLSTALFAQSTLGTLTGVVTDQSAASFPVQP
jgi:hypothetical protein